MDGVVSRGELLFCYQRPLCISIDEYSLSGHSIINLCSYSIILGTAKKRDVRTITSTDLGPPNKTAVSFMQQKNGHFSQKQHDQQQRVAQMVSPINGRSAPSPSDHHHCRKCLFD